MFVFTLLTASGKLIGSPIDRILNISFHGLLVASPDLRRSFARETNSRLGESPADDVGIVPYVVISGESPLRGAGQWTSCRSLEGEQY